MVAIFGRVRIDSLPPITDCPLCARRWFKAYHFHDDESLMVNDRIVDWIWK